MSRPIHQNVSHLQAGATKTNRPWLVLGSVETASQGTSNTTSVTCHSPICLISMFGTVAAGAGGSFTLNNRFIDESCYVTAHVVDNGYVVATGKPLVTNVGNYGTGTCNINFVNTDGANGTVAGGAVLLVQVHQPAGVSINGGISG